MVTTPTVFQAFQALSPGFEDTVELSPDFQIPLGLASRFVNDLAWGDSATYAKALLIAHFALVLGEAGGRGPVTQEVVGNVSRQYASMGADGFDQTTWGSVYILLRKATFFLPMVY